MASIFRRGKSQGWWIKYYVNGRQVYYSLRTNDFKVAKRIKRQIEGEEAKGELLAPSKTPHLLFLRTSASFLGQLGPVNLILVMFRCYVFFLVQFVLL
jgi:hypothetical protein